MYILELENNVYFANLEGYLIHTLLLKSAKKYKLKKDAKIDLQAARKFRNFPDAEIVKICPKCFNAWEKDNDKFGCWVCGIIPSKGKAKYYFSSRFLAEYCAELDYWKDIIKDEKINELELYEAEIDYNSNHFYCSELVKVYEKNQLDCGKYCEFYTPRNGKNGRCRYNINPYSSSNKLLILKR